MTTSRAPADTPGWVPTSWEAGRLRFLETFLTPENARRQLDWETAKREQQDVVKSLRDPRTGLVR